MSAEEFIYSMIDADNVPQLDLNVIASTLANADSLIRQIKAQQVENEGLKEKIVSLRSSALQIKQLYEAEVGKNRNTVSREEDYIRQLKELEARARDAENARVNAELREKETVAELERQLEQSQQKYNGLAVDMLRNGSLLVQNSLLPSNQQAKLRDLRTYVQNLAHNGVAVPEDALAAANKKRSAKRRHKLSGDTRDQSTMTIGTAVSSIAVNTIAMAAEMETSSTSTSTHDLEVDSAAVSSSVTPPAKTFANKSTMYCSSTITRSTCTSAFIKRIDVGVNYPEVVPKSIDDILRECVVELPSLLSPILDEIPVRKESAQTQTEPEDNLALNVQRPDTVTVSCGTNTVLRNIRRKLDYVRKTDSHASSSQVFSVVKKEERISPANSIQNLPAALHQQDEAAGGVNPKLTQIWGLLGETMFRLLGTGRIFDSQSYTTINERLAIINSMIDPDSSQDSQIMSEVLAAATAAMVSGRNADTPKMADTVESSPDKADSSKKSVNDYEEQPVAEERDGRESTRVSGADVSLEKLPTESNDMTTPATAIPELVDDTSCEMNATSLVTEEESSSSLAETASVEPKIEADAANRTKVHTVTDTSSCSTNASSSVVSQHLETTSLEEDTKNSIQRQQLPPLEEHDEIANELRLMEGDDGACVIEEQQVSPTEFQLPDLSEVGKKRYVQVSHEEESVASTDDEWDGMMIVESSSSSRLSDSSSCQSIGSNGTLISPIKVRETNDLVKDQFKTPTSPAISKRKRRDRFEASTAKRGRLSPTTESLLGDDWDLKFSHIKDYFALPSSLNPIEEAKRNLDYREDITFDDSAMSSTTGQFVMPEEQFMQMLSSDEHLELQDSPLSPDPDDSVAQQRSDLKESLHISIPETQISTSDSPESPPLEDSTSPMFTDMQQFDSPASPCALDCGREHDAVEPVVIPLENAISSRVLQHYGNTPIGKTVAMYSTSKRAEVLRNMSTEMSKAEIALHHRIAGVVKAYMSQEWTVENLRQRCDDLLAITTDTRAISLVVIERVVSHEDLVPDTQCSPPAPVLPRTVQQLVLLVKTLNESLFTLDKVILHELDRKVFTLKADKVKLEAITALAYLYIGIADCNRLYGCTARLYIYKCLYYFNFKGLPLIYNILKAFPHALPKKSSQFFDNSDAVVNTIRTILMNMNYSNRSTTQDASLYKKSELLKLLKSFYGYQQGSPTYDELITNLVEKIKANKLRNVDYCLIVVAKRKGYEWAKDHIVQRQLYPLLNDYLKQMGTDGTIDDRICCLIFAISAILKTQPNSQDVTRFMQMFGSIVEMSDGNRRVQEAAVAGLVRFTRFGFADVYEWLCKWCPSYEVNGRIKLMLATFVHRKENHFWKQLNQREIV